MEAFFQTHNYLLEELGNPVNRKLMDEIDWSKQIIGIKGIRGIGKTTFLLQFAKQFGNTEQRDCLYINMNSFTFTTKTLFNFAQEFLFKGGKILLIDQILKYPDWSSELRKCHDLLKGLRIIFTTSTLVQIDQMEDLKSIVKTYQIQGFSFREFLNLTTNHNFEAYSLKDIIYNHQQIARNICSHIKPLAFFRDYIYYGYYPFFLEKKNFSENLLKQINMMLEIDILSIKQMEQSYLPKLRKLLYMLSLDAPQKPNISQLSIECGTSRATINNYIEYLKDAHLINLLYQKEDDCLKKTNLVYQDNTNLVFAMGADMRNDQTIRETFFYNQLDNNRTKVYKAKDKNTFQVEDETENSYIIKIDESKAKRNQKNDNIYHTAELMEIGYESNQIPLWLFGFLY